LEIGMTRLRVHAYSVSLDGFGAGPDQSRANPLGRDGEALHAWAFGTRTIREKVFGQDGGETGKADDLVRMGFENVGAWIMGRNMFTPERGPWTDPDWQGWWGDAPVVLGSGAALFDGLDLRALGYSVRRQIVTDGALHAFLARDPS